jgi:signal transduction histidine kinase
MCAGGEQVGDGLGLADEPRSGLEQTLGRLLDSAQPGLTTESRLRGLLEAYRSVVESLDPDDVLRRIVEAAVLLVRARDAAIAVFDGDGGVERVIHARGPGNGSDEETGGPLAVRLERGRPRIVERVERDPQQIGFPADDDLATAFLAVPIRSRVEAYGALYLSGRDGGDFTREDEDLMTALAAGAGIALENARLYEQSRRRQRWSAALAEVSSALLSEDVTNATGVVLARVATVVESDMACVVVPVADAADDPGPTGGDLLILTARGIGAEPFEGRRYPRAGSLVDRALTSGRVVLAARSRAAVSTEADMGPTLVVPVVVSGEAVCALTLSRTRGGARFTAEDADLASDFAGQVGVAIELTRARADRQRLELADERGRIARDLHDHVIQRLFGAGLSLQSVAARHPEAAADILDQVDAIDGAIAEIRTAVFALSERRRDDGPSTRRRVLDVVGELTAALGATPRLTFTGPVDLMVTGDLADDVVAVVREGLANAARHASADSVAAEIAVGDTDVVVTVVDDGGGLEAATGRRSGTGNLTERAERRGGRFELIPGERGTRAVWRVPLASAHTAPSPPTAPTDRRRA